MQLAPPALTSAPLARLEFVIRAPHGATKPATIDAFVAEPETAQRVTGSFEDAVRVAQAAAAKGALDGFHRIPINPAQAVVQAGAGAWLVAPVVGAHRDAVGPIFIDGPFFERTGLAVYGTRSDAASGALAAIVGVEGLLDFHRGQPSAGMTPIDKVLA